MAWLSFLRSKPKAVTPVPRRRAPPPDATRPVPPAPNARVAPTAPVAHASAADVAVGARAVVSAHIADHLFLPTLLGIAHLDSSPMAPHERQLIDRLDELHSPTGDASPLLPRLPVVLPQLMRLVRRGDAGPRALADCVARDPALVGEVVRLANAGLRSGDHGIADLSQAVAHLGERGLTQLVTRVAMRPVFAVGQGSASSACGPRLWKLAERGAQACVLVAGSGTAGRGIDPFQAYLAGLVAHVGAIAALRQFDVLERHRPLPVDVAFYMALHASMARLSGHFARQWQFPEPVCRAAEQLAERAVDTDSPLTTALRVGDRVARLQLLSPDLSPGRREALSDVERACFTGLEQAFANADA